ncbi:MAG: hypothetical protein JO171_01305 [Paludibacterium sp.]|uniref:hypothetical protein n=1 Tax=Paludibacterium sp. TaxID=1917523 RepID=UPI0025DD458D|nr:hypothetical protein [Paludibacterium sp.]MBV8045763.1 hypothetical protein [Paludibacterium sp.]MBV8648504.1 hypothetical protein [Paludibacterium sp.]
MPTASRRAPSNRFARFGAALVCCLLLAGAAEASSGQAPAVEVVRFKFNCYFSPIQCFPNASNEPLYVLRRS